MTIGELADAAGCSRRAVRFYVMRQLLPPPIGRGRGGHYAKKHLAQLQRVKELQQAGHSLDAIAEILAGRSDAMPSPPSPRPARPAGRLVAGLWTRVRLGEGIELSFDATRYRPTAEALLGLRDVVLATLRKSGEVNGSVGSFAQTKGAHCGTNGEHA